MPPKSNVFISSNQSCKNKNPVQKKPLENFASLQQH
jgi:hypothetical protein